MENFRAQMRLFHLWYLAALAFTLIPTARVLAAPATQPAGDAPRLLVLPFHETTASNEGWVGKAIQQDLVAELTRATVARVEGPSAQAPAQDAAAAMDAAKKTDAAVVVYGQFQSVNGQMRITGQILSVPNGQPVGSISATGPANDLFPLEDTVSIQVMRALPAGLLTIPVPPDPTAPAVSIPQAAASQPSAAAQPASSAKYYSYTYPDYSSGPPSLYPTTYLDSPYYYGYPYYWYSIPYYGPDIFFFDGDFDHFHHHHHQGWGSMDHWHEGGLHEFGGAGQFHPHEMTHAPAVRSFGGARGGGSFGGGGGFHGGGEHR